MQYDPEIHRLRRRTRWITRAWTVILIVNVALWAGFVEFMTFEQTLISIAGLVFRALNLIAAAAAIWLGGQFIIEKLDK